jgi:hypothetical protein
MKSPALFWVGIARVQCLCNALLHPAFYFA